MSLNFLRNNTSYIIYSTEKKYIKTRKKVYKNYVYYQVYPFFIKTNYYWNYFQLITIKSPDS